jgi:Uma2 family endonuclease
MQIIMVQESTNDAARIASTVASKAAIVASTAEPSVRPLRRVEYEQLTELGMFGDEKIELLRGTLVRMSPQGPYHANVVAKLTNGLARMLDPRFEVRPQLPFSADDTSMPEPDIMIVEATGSLTSPHPSRTLLMIEVSVSSLRLDRGLKAEIYSQAGVPEYWIIDIVHRKIIVHRDPRDDGYASVQTVVDGDALTPLNLPITLQVGEFLPPPE